VLFSVHNNFFYVYSLFVPCEMSLSSADAACSRRDLEYTHTSALSASSALSARYASRSKLFVSNVSNLGTDLYIVALLLTAPTADSTMSLTFLTPAVTTLILPLDSHASSSALLTSASDSTADACCAASSSSSSTLHTDHADPTCILSVQIDEIDRACGFCSIGRPIDLWHNKMAHLESGKTSTHVRYASHLASRLYTFATGNQPRTPTTCWPPQLDVLNSDELPVRQLDTCEHDASLADGWLLLVLPTDRLAAPLTPSIGNMLTAQLLMRASPVPSRSWCDILCVTFSLSDMFDYTQYLDVERPLAKNCSLTRVYYSPDLSHTVSVRLHTFCALSDVSSAPAWFTSHANMQRLETVVVNNTKFAQPHTFLCNGRYGTFVHWRNCFERALVVAHARRADCTPCERLGEPSLYLPSGD